MTDEIVLGIDLGTTFSSTAYINDRGRPEIIKNADGESATPSVVHIRDGAVTVGRTALHQWITDEEHTARFVKRAIGDPGYRRQGLSAVEISAEIIKSLRSDAAAALGAAPEEAVITCPAYFNTDEIGNTRRAGELAGFRVREIVKEPIAAGVYYGVEAMREGETVLVCDLGGGTFDATVLSFADGAFSPLACSGSRRLGGYDWTADLVELVAERCRERHGADPRDELVAGQLLFEACEQAKRDFARVDRTAVACRLDRRIEQIELLREEFEAKTEHRFLELVLLCEAALGKAGLSWEGIDTILLVGGSSRLRRMARALEESSGKPPVRAAEPDLMVAYGAAILARGEVKPRGEPPGGARRVRGGLVEVRHRRILSRNFGTYTVLREGERERIVAALVLPHGTQAPVSRSREDLALRFDGQPHFDVPVIEYESEDACDIKLCFRFACPAQAKKGDRIRLTFSYDLNGIVSAEAFDERRGRSLPAERVDYHSPPPTRVMFAIDLSMSMRGENLDNAKRALSADAEELLRCVGGSCHVGIVSFATKAELVCPLSEDIGRVRAAVESLIPAGRTAMDAGILLAAAELGWGSVAGAQRFLILLTDGLPDDRNAAIAAAKEAKAKGIRLAALGIGTESIDLDFLRLLTPDSRTVESAADIAGGLGGLLAQTGLASFAGLAAGQDRRPEAPRMRD